MKVFSAHERTNRVVTHLFILAMPTTRSQTRPSGTADPELDTQEVTESTEEPQWKLTLEEPDMTRFAPEVTRTGSSSSGKIGRSGKVGRGAYDTTHMVTYKKTLEYWRRYDPQTVTPISQRPGEDLSSFCKRIERLLLNKQILRSETEDGANIGIWALRGSVQRVSFKKTKMPTPEAPTT